jgi:hypothetical protein
MRRLTFAACIMLTACTGGSETPAPPLLPSDPCALLTIHDVESATGSRVIRSGLVPESKMIVPTDPKPCRYVTNGRDASIYVSVDPHGAATFARYRDRDPVNDLAIKGVGDEAFVQGLATLWVRVGGGYFAVSTQHGAGPSAVEPLKKLAEAALSHTSTAS